MRLAIIGAAELGGLIAHHAEEDQGWEVVGYYDDFSKASEFLERPVLGNTEQLLGHFKEGRFDALMIGIGYNHMTARASLFDRFKNQIPFARLVHSSAYVDPSCTVGEGVFLFPRVVVDMHCVIEDNVLINTGGIVAHHTIVGAHSFLAPGVHIAGRIAIGPRCFLGIGCTIADLIHVGENAFIGAGSVVISDVPANTLSVGVPARVIKDRNA